MQSFQPFGVPIMELDKVSLTHGTTPSNLPWLLVVAVDCVLPRANECERLGKKREGTTTTIQDCEIWNVTNLRFGGRWFITKLSGGLTWVGDVWHFAWFIQVGMIFLLMLGEYVFIQIIEFGEVLYIFLENSHQQNCPKKEADVFLTNVRSFSLSWFQCIICLVVEKTKPSTRTVWSWDFSEMSSGNPDGNEGKLFGLGFLCQLLKAENLLASASLSNKNRT